MHRTDEVTLTLKKPGSKPVVFTLPLTKGREVEVLIRRMSRQKGSLSADVVFPVLADDVQRPCAVLRGSRHKEGMTQVELAGRLAIRQSHLSEMENGKRPIGKNMAKKLANIFDCDFRVFL